MIPKPMNTATNSEARVAQAKNWRKRLDDILQELKEQAETETRGEKTRQLSIAITDLESVIMRLGMRLKGIDQETPGAAPDPYPQSKNPESPVVEKTADGLTL